MRKVSLKNIISSARKIAEKYPDVVYINTIPGKTTCSYCYGGANDEGCIIGQAIKLAYPELYDIIAGIEKGNIVCDINRDYAEKSLQHSPTICSFIKELIREKFIETEESDISLMLNWLQSIQNKQDGCCVDLGWKQIVTQVDDIIKV